MPKKEPTPKDEFEAKPKGDGVVRDYSVTSDFTASGKLGGIWKCRGVKGDKITFPQPLDDRIQHFVKCGHLRPMK